MDDLPPPSPASLPDPTAEAPLFARLLVVGIGLIGGSILRRALSDPAVAREVVAFDADPAVRQRARELGLAHRIPDTLEDAARAADGAVLCVPVGAMAAAAAGVVPHLAPGAVLSDVGSTKQSVIGAIAPLLRPDVSFVPAHPLAGTEHSGPESGFPALFEGRWSIVVPLPGADPASVSRIEALWRRCGSQTCRMDPVHHDRTLAMVSHLPHLIAFTICGTTDDLEGETRAEVLQFAASGFRDFTRIAASDPTMWRDVFLNNREALLEMLARFTEDAQAMARAIRWGDEAFIVDRIERGRRIRRGLIENRQA